MANSQTWLRVRSSEVTRTCQSQTTFLFTFILNQANQKTSKTMGGLYEVESLQRSMQRMHLLPNLRDHAANFPLILLDEPPTKVLPREALTTHQTCWNLANMTLVWCDEFLWIAETKSIEWIFGKRNPNGWHLPFIGLGDANRMLILMGSWEDVIYNIKAGGLGRHMKKLATRCISILKNQQVIKGIIGLSNRIN